MRRFRRLRKRRFSGKRKRSLKFARNALRVHRKNLIGNPMRGGFRL